MIHDREGSTLSHRLINYFETPTFMCVLCGKMQPNMLFLFFSLYFWLKHGILHYVIPLCTKKKSPTMIRSRQISPCQVVKPHLRLQFTHSTPLVRIIFYESTLVYMPNKPYIYICAL